MNNKQSTIYKKGKLLVSFVFCSLFIVNYVSAYTAEIVIDTGNVSINALEGSIHIPSGVNIEEIQTGHSAIVIWIKPPTLEANNTITFSGITPGGFRGKQPLFSFSGELNSEDLSQFTYSQVVALKDDGSGTTAKVTLSARYSDEVLEDSIPPELFVPIISRSEDLFGGKPFVTFLSQDKGVGIDRYEYASTWFFSPSEKEWKQASSPQEIKTSELFKKIYIRAVDKNGNEQTAHMVGTYHHYASLMIGIIIIACALLLLRRSFL